MKHASSLGVTNEISQSRFCSHIDLLFTLIDNNGGQICAENC